MTNPNAEGAVVAPNEFDALISDLDTFSKAMAADPDDQGDANIAAAAAEGEQASDAAGTDGDPAAASGDGAEGDDVMGKSFGVTLEDGSTEEVFDATPLLKSLMVDRDMLKGQVADQGVQLSKALTALTGAVGALKQTGDLIKSLQADVKTLRNTGVGRKGVLDIHERQSTAAPAVVAPDGIKPGEFMSKAMELNAKGEMTANEIASLELGFQRGRIPDPAIVRRVMGA